MSRCHARLVAKTYVVDNTAEATHVAVRLRARGSEFTHDVAGDGTHRFTIPSAPRVDIEEILAYAANPTQPLLGS